MCVVGTAQGSKCGDPDHRYAEVPTKQLQFLQLKRQWLNSDHFPDFSPGQTNSDIHQGVKGAYQHTMYSFSPVNPEQETSETQVCFIAKQTYFYNVTK